MCGGIKKLTRSNLLADALDMLRQNQTRSLQFNLFTWYNSSFDGLLKG